MARNEVERDYAYNRALFMRVAQGWYQFNPKLAVRRPQGDEERWMPIYAALNLPLINEFSYDNGWESLAEPINDYLTRAGLPKCKPAIAAERALAREALLQQQKEAQIAEARAAKARQLAERAAAPLKWGTREARNLEIERLEREIEERKKR